MPEATPIIPDPLQVNSVGKVARLLDVNERTVRRLIQRGELPAVRIGRRVGVRHDDLAAFLDRSRMPHGKKLLSFHDNLLQDSRDYIITSFVPNVLY